MKPWKTILRLSVVALSSTCCPDPAASIAAADVDGSVGEKIEETWTSTATGESGGERPFARPRVVESAHHLAAADSALDPAPRGRTETTHRRKTSYDIIAQLQRRTSGGTLTFKVGGKVQRSTRSWELLRAWSVLARASRGRSDGDNRVRD